MAGSVFDLFARLLLDDSEFKRGLDGAKGYAQSGGSRIGNAIKGGLKVAAAALAAGGTAAVAFGKSAVDAGMQFDYSMSQVQAISGANAEEFDRLREKAREMGRTTKFTAQEAANAFLYMGMAGWEADEMISGIPGILNLASAAGADLGTTSDIVTDALTAFHLEAKDSAHFADVLAQASARSNTNVGLMGETFKYVAPLAGQMNYSIEDVATAIGLMANSGVKGSMAGTSLRSILTRLASPSKDAAAAMDRLGVSLQDDEGNMYSLREVMVQLRDGFANNLKMPAEEVAKKLADLDAQFEAGKITEDEYAEATEALAKEAFGAEEALAAQAASAIAGKYGMSGLLAIVGASEEDFQKLTKAIDESSETIVKTADGSIMTLNEALESGAEIIERYNGMAEAMATIMEDNLQGDVTKLKSAFSDLKIEVSDALTPALRGFVQEATEKIVALTEFIHNGGLGDALDGIKDGFNRIKEAISPLTERIMAFATSESTATGAANLLKGAFDLFIEALHIGAEALAFVIDKIGAFIEWLNSGSTSAEAMKVAVVALIAGFAAFEGVNAILGLVRGAFLALNAVMAANPIALVVAAVAALAAGFVYLYNTNETFKNFVDTAWASIKDVIINAIENIKAGLQALGEFFAPLIESIKGFLNALIEFAKSAASAIGDYLKSFYESHKTQIDAFCLTVKTIVSGAIDLIKGILETAFTYIRDAVKGTIDVVTGILNTLSALLKGDFKGAWDAAKETVKTFKENVVETITNLGENISKALGDLAKHALDWGKDMLGNFVNGIKEKWNDLKQAVNDTAQKIKDFLGFSKPKEGPLSDADTYGSDFIKLWISGMQGEEGNLGTAVKNIATLVYNGINDTWETAKTLGNALIERIKGGTNEKAESLISGAGQVATKTGEVISKAWEGAKTIGSNLMARLHNGMGEGSTALGEAAVKNATNVRDAFSKGWENVKTLGSNFIENIKGGVAERAEGLVSGVSQIASQTKDTLSMIWEGAKEIGSNFISLLHSGITEKATELSSAVTNFATQIPQIIANAWNNMKTYGSNLVDQISSGVSERASALVQAVQNIITVVGDAFSQAWQNAKALGANFIAQIHNGIAENASSVFAAVQEIIKNVSEALTKGWENAKTIGSNLITNIRNGIASVSNGLNETVGTIAKNVSESISKAWEGAKTLGSNMIENIKGGLSEKANDVVSIASKVAENTKNAFTKGWDKADAIGSNFISKITNGFSSKTSALIDNVSKVVDGIKNVFTKFSDSAQKLGEGIIGNIRNGIASRVSEISSAMSQIGSSLNDVFRNLASSASSWGRDLIGNFVDGLNAKLSELRDRAVAIAQQIKNVIGFSEPKEGPLSRFHTFAPDMMELFAKGIKDNEGLVKSQIEKSFDFGSAFGSSFSNGTVVSTAGSTENVGGQRQQPAVLMLDRTILGRVVYDLYNEEAQRVGVKLAGGIA